MSGSNISPIQSMNKSGSNNSDIEFSLGSFSSFNSSSNHEPIEQDPKSSNSNISHISGNAKSFGSKKSDSSKKSNKQDNPKSNIKSNPSSLKGTNGKSDNLSDVVDLSLDEKDTSNLSLSDDFLNSTQSKTQNSKTKPSSTLNIETVDSTFSTNQTSKQETKTDLLKTSTLTKAEGTTQNNESSQMNALQTTNSTTSQLKTEKSKSSAKYSSSNNNSKISTKSKSSEKHHLQQSHNDDEDKPQQEPVYQGKQQEEKQSLEKPKAFDNPLYPRKSWYEQEPEEQKQKIENEKDAEIERLTNLVRDQRTIINNQKETIRLLMSESVKHEEITSLRAALASKSPLLQLVAATPMSEQRATKQLRAENEALRREIDEIEMRHLNELKAMRAQFATLSSRPMPTDGCAQCKRRIRELENQLKQYENI